MRFYGLALLASAAVLGACGGGEKKATDTTQGRSSGALLRSGRCRSGGRRGRRRLRPPARRTTVKMIGDDKGYRFEPADITIKAGDAIKFVMVTGGPHNVAFDPATIPADVEGAARREHGQQDRRAVRARCYEPERGVRHLVRRRQAGQVRRSTARRTSR